MWTWDWKARSSIRQIYYAFALSLFYQGIQCFDILLWPIFIWPQTTVLVDRSAFCWTKESIYIKNLDLGLTAIRRDWSEPDDSSQQSYQNTTSSQGTLNHFSKAQKQYVKVRRAFRSAE